MNTKKDEVVKNSRNNSLIRVRTFFIIMIFIFLIILVLIYIVDRLREEERKEDKISYENITHVDSLTAPEDNNYGVIRGNINYPYETTEIIKICVFNIDNDENICSKEFLKSEKEDSYLLEVPPGNYYIYAESKEQYKEETKRGYYTPYARCLATKEIEKCLNEFHAPVEVVIEKDTDISSINAFDWTHTIISD